MGRETQNATYLSGRRIILRSLRPDDFEQWREVRRKNYDWLVKWEPTRNDVEKWDHLEKDAFFAKCEAWEMERRHGRGHQFGVFLSSQDGAVSSEDDAGSGFLKKGRVGRKHKKSEKFIGELNVSSIQRGVFQNCFLGYWIDERYAGNGYIPEAAVTVFRFAFEDLGLHRVQISIVPRNSASLRVVEKLKLRQEGLAERYLEIYGKWEDHNIFAITAEEYFERQKELYADWLE